MQEKPDQFKGLKSKHQIYVLVCVCVCINVLLYKYWKHVNALERWLLIIQHSYSTNPADVVKVTLVPPL